MGITIRKMLALCMVCLLYTSTLAPVKGVMLMESFIYLIIILILIERILHTGNKKK